MHPTPIWLTPYKCRPHPVRATGSPCRRPRIPSFTNNVNQQSPTAKPPSRITPPGDPPPREDAYMVPPPPPSNPLSHTPSHPLTSTLNPVTPSPTIPVTHSHPRLLPLPLPPDCPAACRWTTYSASLETAATAAIRSRPAPI